MVEEEEKANSEESVEAAPAPVVPPEEISLDDLDKILEEEDPEFTKGLESMKTDFADAKNQVVDLDVSPDEDDQEKPEEIREEDMNIRELFIHRLKQYAMKPFVKFKKVGEKIQPKIRAVKHTTILFWQQFMSFVRHELPERIKYLRSRMKDFKQYVLSFWVAFKELELRKKVATVLIIVASFCAFFFVTRIFEDKWLPRFRIGLLENWVYEGKELDQVTDPKNMMSFFEAFPEIEVQVRLKKIVVNLRRDERSGPNPMALFEFILGLDSKDTAIEVKDREKEIIDIVQRTLEGFTYHQVMSHSGKFRFKAAIRENVNSMLNQGSLHRVYINRIVTYN